ncbi:MAG: hypothetical protein V2I35_14605 [Desulfocapsaceae bacterium]|jgi:hypothetical protein|nr:hypothetical protein [Desulfocapsaceae bacterium]
MAEKNSKSAVCRSCVNYYITHDMHAPHGCRALGFKSRKIPTAVVEETSGIACQLYMVKTNKTFGGSGGGDVC